MNSLSRPAVLALIGNTPLVEVTRFDTGPCELYLKLESQNPGGSIKDRIGVAMIEAAERDGRLQPGGTVIEATAGNTGLGLALVARAKGYRVVLVVPDKMSSEKVLHLKALGAEVHVTRSDVGKGHPDYYQDMARRLSADIRRALSLQTNSTTLPTRSRTRRARPRDLGADGPRVDAIVVGVGSAGTITGLDAILPRGTAIASLRAGRSARLDPCRVREERRGRQGRLVGRRGHRRGLRSRRSPTSRVSREAYSIPDEESFATARELLKREGHPRRLVDRHVACRRPALLPRADRAAARRQLCLRHRTRYLRRSTTTSGWSTRVCWRGAATATCAT